MTGDSGQREEGGEVKEDMEEGQHVENSEETHKMCIR